MEQTASDRPERQMPEQYPVSPSRLFLPRFDANAGVQLHTGENSIRGDIPGPA